MATATDFLSTYIEPIADGLTLPQAQQILAIVPSDKLIARVEELAEKSENGSLTAEERTEYEYYVDVDDVIGLLKAKARRVVASPMN